MIWGQRSWWTHTHILTQTPQTPLVYVPSSMVEEFFSSRLVRHLNIYLDGQVCVQSIPGVNPNRACSSVCVFRLHVDTCVVSFDVCGDVLLIVALNSCNLTQCLSDSAYQPVCH